ncbi:MAG: tetratricopeptide repeat protein [Planctomycetes bacterium]|nr:tetratricopeptide repeat protein [Planctomycetota bacterium]
MSGSPKEPARKGGPGVRINPDVIRTARLAKGWSQLDLAKAVGWGDANMVFRIEKRGTASPESLRKLVDALDLSIGDVLTTRPPPGFSRGVFQLPSSLPNFTGRGDELKRITDRLRVGSGSVGVSSALRGMGGVGKTVTAIEACWEVKDDFPDGQLVVELRGIREQPLTPVQAMSQIIRDFHPEADKLPDDENALQALYRKVLEGKKALVLLDDAKDEAQVRSLLCVRSVAFVITSRNALALDGVESIRLGVLSPSEARTLLRDIVGPSKGTDEELQAVAELCGRLPLALRVAGDFLRLHDNWSLPKYTVALQDESKRLEKLKGKSPDRDVEAVLALSACELVNDNAERAERWQALSVFPADFNALAAAVLWDLKTGDKLDTDTAEDELTALIDRSVVQFDPVTSRYSLHDLMRPIARAVFDFVDEHPLRADSARRIAVAERRAAEHYHHALVAAQQRFATHDARAADGLTLFDRERENIVYGQRWAADHATTDRDAARLALGYGLGAFDVLNLRLTTGELEKWANTALGASRFLGSAEAEAIALNVLGTARRYAGDARAAVAHYEQSLTAARRAGDEQSVENALANLGWAHNALGDGRAALGYLAQGLELARKRGDRVAEGQYHGNLGGAHSALGNHLEALRHHALQLAVAVETGSPVAEANAVCALGEVSNRMGRYPTAARFHEWHLALATGLKDRRGEGVALGNLANSLVGQHQLPEALERCQRAIALQLEIDDCWGAAFTYFTFARICRDLGRTDEAIKAAERSFEFFRQMGHSHAETVRRKLAEWRGEAAAS